MLSDKKLLSHARQETAVSRRTFMKTGLFSGIAGALLGRSTASAQPSAQSVADLQNTAPQPRTVNDPQLLNAGTKTNSSIAATFEAIKQEGSKEDLYRFLYAMPKGGDIHHHMGGSMLPEMWWEAATNPELNGGQTFFTRFQITSRIVHPRLRAWIGPHTIKWMTVHEQLLSELDPDVQKDFKPMHALSDEERKEWMSSVVLDSEEEGRNEFFEYHWPRLGSLLSDFTVTTNLLVENMKRFGAEGCRYIEIMSNPWNKRMPDGSILEPEAFVAKFIDRLNQPDALATGVMVRLQAVVIRFTDNAEDRVRACFDFIDKNRALYRGINMAGREDDNRGYPSRFTEVFDEMLRKYTGIGISIHAGEAEKPDSYIADTLRLGATRIGHGCNLIRSQETLQQMRAAGHLVEINLISNHLLKYVPDPDQHPFPIYMRQGIPCCLNTDDRGMWDSNLTDEYMLAVTRFNLSWDEVVKLSRNSLTHSFLNEQERPQLMTSFENDLEYFSAKFGTAGWEERLSEVEAVTYGYGKKHLGLNL
jgi:adenosine deaminase CECR1